MPQQNITCKLLKSFYIKGKIKKCEISRIGSLKGATEADCEINLIDLTNDTVKILRLQFSYTKKIQFEHNFLHFIIKLEQVIFYGIIET